MDWKSHGPDLLTWFRHASRQDAAPLPLCRPHFGPEGNSDLEDLILPLRTDTVDPTSIGREFCELRDQLGLPVNFDSLANAAKCSAISDAGW